MNVKRIGFGLELVVAILILITATAEIFSGSEGTAGSKIEKAILAGDWKAVVNLCGPNEQLVSSPVLRAIKGHACLALNRNNESLLLLLSIDNDSDRQVWKEWAIEFAKQNPKSPVAHYFKGDTLARCGEWHLAIQSFNKALKLHPNFALALNGRGVVYAYKKMWNKALKDLEKACEKDPSFAEAHASLGSLLILKRAPEGAYKAFNKALAISPDFAMAYNGRACAEYGLVEWEQANEDFANAGRRMALPLFLGNLRALSIAAERSQLPGLENSPLFRVTDFLNWEALRQATSKEGDILRILLGDHQLPETIDISIIKKLNKALDNPQFYDQVKDKIDLTNIPRRLSTLIDETRPLRNKRPTELTESQLEKIRLLNRMLIELTYPYLIAQHDQRDPGMQLTLTKGLVNQLDYKKSLTPDQIIMGQATMDYLGGPIANLLETSGIPVINWLGKQWNDHIKCSTETNRIALRDEYGLDLDNYRTGGVLANLRRAYVDKGDWPVVNWFGLAYVSQ